VVRLILVRHGESEWNVEGRLQGVADPPLSDAGRRQARALAPLLAALRPERAVSSDLRRASETLALAAPGAAALPPDPRWREADLGDWTGRLPREMSPAEADALRLWRIGRATPPGGESWDDRCARVRAALRGLVATGAGRVLVVTHGGTVRAACATLAGLDPAAMAPVANASVTVIETAPVAHLLALGVTPAPAPAPAEG
jgi:glucosyl-3-phosphoglycerate phosphatase